jgi:hypothetical protein
MTGTVQPLSRISSDSADHNKGIFRERFERLKQLTTSRPVGRLGNAPQWMVPAERKIWKTLARTAPLTLGANDRTLMEICVTLKAKLEKHDITTSELSQLVHCLKALGFIPVDRKAVEAPKDADLLDRFDT